MPIIRWPSNVDGTWRRFNCWGWRVCFWGSRLWTWLRLVLLRVLPPVKVGVLLLRLLLQVARRLRLATVVRVPTTMVTTATTTAAMEVVAAAIAHAIVTATREGELRRRERPRPQRRSTPNSWPRPVEDATPATKSSKWNEWSWRDSSGECPEASPPAGWPVTSSPFGGRCCCSVVAMAKGNDVGATVATTRTTSKKKSTPSSTSPSSK
mmetsp:Transcript_1768/g.3991  ORF Transcript_1768/g.3991 Transcript_1768/m.3991 type:complete len:209 (+) Transcript_1768:496-1122(+)